MKYDKQRVHKYIKIQLEIERLSHMRTNQHMCQNQHFTPLENPGKVPLEIIEVQNGEYVGEDDIVRVEDYYGRTEK